MNKVVINEQGELIAYVSDKHDNIIMNGYDIIDYGSNEPVFTTDMFGRIILSDNKFIVNLSEVD